MKSLYCLHSLSINFYCFLCSLCDGYNSLCEHTLFILQSFCNHLKLLQNPFIDLLLNHHKITGLRTLTFYHFIAFYLSQVQFVTATLAFVNTLLNQALWIKLIALLINNQNLYFFTSANQCPGRGSTHGERAWGCKEKAYHGQSKKIFEWRPNTDKGNFWKTRNKYKPIKSPWSSSIGPRTPIFFYISIR